MSLVKLLSPAYWYLVAAKLGGRLILIVGGLAALAALLVSGGVVDVGSIGGGMLRSLIGV